MVTQLSLREFRERFTDGLLQTHWRQWAALGVATHVQPEEGWIIDLEALTVSTLTLGLRDARLFGASLEWLIRHGEWLNLPRLKRIAKVFIKSGSPTRPQMSPLLEPKVFELLGETLKKFGQKVWTDNRIENQKFRGAAAEYETFFRTFQMRNVVTDPLIEGSSLLQLRLRSIFGIDARVETLIFLLNHDRGNSNAIAKEIFYDQKNIYGIFQKWSKGGLLTMIKAPRAGIVTLERKEEWRKALGIRKMPAYINWVQVFLFLDECAKAILTPPWSNDEYLISSFFKDILNRAKLIAPYLNITFPKPEEYPGEKFFTPFALKVLEFFPRIAGK